MYKFLLYSSGTYCRNYCHCHTVEEIYTELKIKRNHVKPYSEWPIRFLTRIRTGNVTYEAEVRHWI